MALVIEFDAWEKRSNITFSPHVIEHFPFLIFYTEFGEFIWIVAIAHAKRKPNYLNAQQLE